MNGKLATHIAVVLFVVLGNRCVAAEDPVEAQLKELAPIKWEHAFGRVGVPEFSPDGKTLLTYREGMVWLWTVATRKNTAILRHGPDPAHPGTRISVFVAAFSPDGKTLVSVGTDNTFKLWDAASGKETAMFKSHGREIACPILFSGDGKTLIALTRKEIQYWDVQKKELRRKLKCSAGVIASYPSAKKPLLAIGPGLTGEPLTLLDAATGEPVRTPQGVLNGATHIAMDRAEKILALTGEDDTARIWDRTTGATTASFELPSVRRRGIVLSPDGKILAVSYRTGRFAGGGRFGGGISLYEVPSGKLLTTLDGHDFEYPTFSPDGKLLATAWQDSIRLWSVPEAWRKKK